MKGLSIAKKSPLTEFDRNIIIEGKVRWEISKNIKIFKEDF